MFIKTLKYIFKLVKRTFLFFFSLIILYLLTAWVCSNIATNPEKELANKSKLIYVVSNGVHTDIIFPLGYLNKHSIDNLNLKTTTEFVAFGWGDKGFYINTPTWGDLTFSTAVNALFLKSVSAMHVTEYSNTTTDWKKVTINEYQLIRIQEAILNTFQQKSNRAFIKIEGYSYGSNDAFYEAKGSFSCFKTCNTWTNQTLKKAEIKTAIWTPFDSGILNHL